MQAHPRHDAGLAGGLEHVSVVADGSVVVHPGLRLEASPLDRQAVMPEAELCQEAEVFGEPRRESVAGS
jgi:hypothetical protein